MDLIEEIHLRQSIGKVKPDPVARDLIEKMLDAAGQAPNHHLVRPWRFVILSGAARERLGDVMAESLRQLKPEMPEAGLNAERAKPLRAPVLIAVGVDKPSDPKVVEIENICAAAAATQNMLLAAHSLGLATMWRTGAAATDPAVKALLGFEPDQHIIAFVYVGYPLTEHPATPNRPSYEDRTRWIE